MLQYRFAADSQPSVHPVRLVAPAKMMLCIRFRLPAAVAVHSPPHAPGTQLLPLPHHVPIARAPSKPIPKHVAAAAAAAAATSASSASSASAAAEARPNGKRKPTDASDAANASSPPAAAAEAKHADKKLKT